MTNIEALTEFLLARIADDKAEVDELRKGIPPDQLAVYDETAVHVAAEFRAKQRIIDRARAIASEPNPPQALALAIGVLLDLASVYDDHPDFDPAWRV